MTDKRLRDELDDWEYWANTEVSRWDPPPSVSFRTSESLRSKISERLAEAGNHQRLMSDLRAMRNEINTSTRMMWWGLAVLAVLVIGAAIVKVL